MSVRISYRYAQSQMFFHRNYNRFSFSKTFRFTTVTRYLSWFFRIRKKKLLESPIHFTLWSTTRSLRYGIPIIFSSLIFFHCHGSARLFRQSARISVRYARWLKLGLFPMIIMFACFCISGRNLTIPENLSLCDSEKSVLSKGLNFVPFLKQQTNSQLNKT